MWNARRNGRWFGWGCLFLSCSILLFRSAAVLRKNHFSEGKVLLQRAAAQAEQLSVDVMMPLLFYDGKEDGRGWMENLLAAVRDQIPALREGSTAENTLSAGTEAAETDTAKQDSNPGPGAERGQTESKEQGTEEDQKDGTQKDETQSHNKDIKQRELSHTVMWLGSFFMLTKRVRRDRSFDKHRTRRIGQFSCTGTPCSFYSKTRK